MRREASCSGGAETVFRRLMGVIIFFQRHQKKPVGQGVTLLTIQRFLNPLMSRRHFY
jgi:hypothetical protein